MNDAPRGLRVGADVFPYADVGRGRPILFLHAAPGDHRMWQPHMALLADRWRCLAYTQRWFGTESWRPDGPPFGSATHATDLVNFVTALDIGPVALAAWSYSGHVALAAALARPDLFTSLFVYEPGFATYVTDPELLALFGEDATKVFAPIIESANEGDYEEAVRRLVDGSGGPGYFDREAEDRRRIHLDSAHVMPRLLSQSAPVPISSEDLASLQVRSLVSCGLKSRPVFLVTSRAAARSIGGIWHFELPLAGHFWPEEEPEEFANQLDIWLSRRPR